MSKGLNNVPKVINRDTVIGFTSTPKIKELGWADQASLSSWYQDDPEKNHLGLIEVFTNFADYRMPTYKNLFENKAVIEVNGINGRFTYDIPVYKDGGLYTSQDTSDFTDFPGIDGSVFPLILDEPMQPGDVLTYDAMFGSQVVVSEDHVVTNVGDGYKHMVTLNSQDPGEWFPKDKLKAGIAYWKTGHVLGEFSEKFSNITSPNPVGSITCEFVLGNHRGVETFYTMYADKKNFNGAALHSEKFWNDFMADQRKLGKDERGNELDMFYVGKLTSDKVLNQNSVRIGSALEYLVVLELMKIEAHQLLFQKGGLVNDINGTKRLNEGIWHQFRRGRIIKYSRPGGITRQHIKDAAAYIFQNRSDLLPTDRFMLFDCGYMAYLNMLELFREEVLAQVHGLSGLLGNDRILPKSPISGQNLTSLRMEPVMFTEVNIPEIGMVKINHDPSLDYLPMTDRRGKGFYGNAGYAQTSYSMMVADASDSKYSNARTNLPSGVRLVQNGNAEANVYYVKPEGASMWWGYSEGRYSPNKTSEIVSSMKHMGREFWAHSVSAGWVKDPTSRVIIELKEIPVNKY